MSQGVVLGTGGGGGGGHFWSRSAMCFDLIVSDGVFSLQHWYHHVYHHVSSYASPVHCMLFHPPAHLALENIQLERVARKSFTFSRLQYIGMQVSSAGGGGGS